MNNTEICRHKNCRDTTIVLCLFVLTLSFSSCRKFVEVPPPTSIVTENFVFTTDATAISVMTDIYRSMNAISIQGASSIALFAGLAADEYKLNDGVVDQSCLSYYKNALSQTSASISGGEHWKPLYNFVFRCNAAIEGLASSSTLTPVIRQQLLGEAKFMRAFFYFYLVNMYGDVPLALTTDPNINALLVRTSKTLVYNQIIEDLKEAKEKLSENFLDVSLLGTSVQRVKPTKWAAAALLARVYLSNGSWTESEQQSSFVIDNTGLFSLLMNLNDVFLKNSREAIWQTQPVDASFNTVEAKALIIPPTGPSIPSNPVQLGDLLERSFETGDKRTLYGNWVDTTIYKLPNGAWDTISYPYKYKAYLPNTNINNSTGTTNMTEYFMVLRLAEQYLIRAEARAMLGEIGEAQQDLNAIRVRAGLIQVFPPDQAALLHAILKERRHELFCEWGHRWFDLKRTGKIDEVMNIATLLKSNGVVQWQPYQALYPIPLTELQRAPNLVQNAGY